MKKRGRVIMLALTTATVAGWDGRRDGAPLICAEPTWHMQNWAEVNQLKNMADELRALTVAAVGNDWYIESAPPRRRMCLPLSSDAWSCSVLSMGRNRAQDGRRRRSPHGAATGQPI